MISLKNLDLTIEGTTILSGISMTLPPGTITILLGENGAGKSMLLKTIAGWHPHYSGSATIDGAEVRDYPNRERAKRIAFIGQEIHTAFDYSVYEVVEMGRFVVRGNTEPLTATDRDAIQSAMNTMDIAHLHKTPITHLSTGEKARVFLARALATEAPVLALDEPTAALDIRRKLEVFQMLKTLANNGSTIVMSIHSLNDALAFNAPTLLLHNGTQAAFGNARDILTPDMIRSVYNVTMTSAPSAHFTL